MYFGKGLQEAEFASAVLLANQQPLSLPISRTDLHQLCDPGLCPGLQCFIICVAQFCGSPSPEEIRESSVIFKFLSYDMFNAIKRLVLSAKVLNCL